MTDSAERFDAVVVGSGIGGLTSAALLSRLRGWRVAVLERQPIPGGFTHGFSREVGQQRFSWDVGIHYVGGMEKGTATRRLMDLVTEGQQDWAPLPDPMEKLIFPDLEIEIPAGRAAFRQSLQDAFPRAGRAIDRSFNHFRRAATWLGSHLCQEGLPFAFAFLARGLEVLDEGFSNQTVGAWLDREVADPRLKGVLGARWGDYGLPPEHGSLGMHALIWLHYLEGAHVPVGGARGIVRGAQRVIEGAGGMLLSSCEVTEILHEEGKATGVKAILQEPGGPRALQLQAPVIISDAGARTTYERLLRSSACDALARSISGLGPTPSAVLLFVGLHRPARELGLSGKNLWIHQQWNHAALWRQRTNVFEGHPQMVFASFARSNDPSSEGREVELSAVIDAETFRQLQISEEVEERTREGLLRTLESAVPGFRRAVAYTELSWPSTFERFGGHPGGSIYGLPATPSRFADPLLGPKTPIAGVALAGADGWTPGIVGSMMGGALACAVVPGGPSIREIFKARLARQA